MITDVEKISFVTVATGETVADVDVSDCFQVGFAVDLDAAAGVFGTATFVAIPLHGTDPVGSLAITGAAHIRKTVDMAAVGIAFLDQKGTALAEIASENVYKKIRVGVTLVGVTSVTGSLYIFKKRF